MTDKLADPQKFEDHLTDWLVDAIAAFMAVNDCDFDQALKDIKEIARAAWSRTVSAKAEADFILAEGMGVTNPIRAMRKQRLDANSADRGYFVEEASP
jgi:hypothetical protein